MKWPLGVLTFWSFIVVNGAWKFPEASKNWLLVCLISLPGLYISITGWAPPVSMWLPYFCGLKRQTEMDPTVCRRSVYALFLQTKQPCSPSKSLRWFGKHLSKGSCIIDFLHGSINKIFNLVTHLFHLFPLFGQPATTQFRCSNPVPREEIKTEWFQTWSISQVNNPFETHKVTVFSRKT